MKFVKRITALFLALTMVMAMGITAFAAETGTISTTSTTHTYEIYQILVGDFDASGNILSAVWGSNAVSGKSGTVDGTDMKAIEDAGKTLEITNPSDKQIAAALKSYVNFGEGSTPVATIGKGNNSSATLATGYYLIKDKDTTQNDAEGEAYTLYLFKPLTKNGITITPKTGTPSVIKKVKDVDDTKAQGNGNPTGWQDSADYDIGDTIPYQLTATLGDISAYNDYWVNFVDVMTHLTYVYDSAEGVKSGVTVKVGDTAVAADDLSVAWDASTKKLTVKVSNLISKYNATQNTKVTVDYNATLDNDAVIGATGNPNEVYLEYKNNPNEDGDGSKGTTPKDKNKVFTYKVVVNKVDANSKPLDGAGFSLYKKDPATNEYVLYTNTKSSSYDKVMVTSNGKTGAELQYTVSFEGLDDGDYKIVETVVPDGYKKGDDITFTISATHEVESADPQLTALAGGDKFTGEYGSADSTTGTLTTKVTNTTVSSLPETGGMGTTILYIAGIALIVVAGVVVIARKRNA